MIFQMNKKAMECINTWGFDESGNVMNKHCDHMIDKCIDVQKDLK